MNNSDSITITRFTHFYRCRKTFYTPAIKPLLENPDAYLCGHMLKIENNKIDATTVGLTAIDGQTYVIKRYNLKNLAHRLKRAFSFSRAARCYRFANTLLQHGIATPDPIAMVEKRWGFLRREAFYIYRFVEGEDALHYFHGLSDINVQAIRRAENLKKLIAKLHHAKLSHGDMKATNFIFVDDEAYCLDLDSMRRHRFHRTFKHRLAKDTKRFQENWQTHPDLMLLFSSNLR